MLALVGGKRYARLVLGLLLFVLIMILGINSYLSPTGPRIDTVVPPVSITDMIGQAELIVKGRVVKKMGTFQGQWNPATPKGIQIVYTDYQLLPERILKGAAAQGQPITLRVIGKEPENRTKEKLQEYFQPRYTTGEQVLLFLEHTPAGDGAYAAVNGSAGTFDVSGQDLINQWDGQVLPESQLVQQIQELSSGGS
ncbi:MAG TPA: hypothetical protein VHS59_00645 [Bacillota bacterium]|nr:hypothetical protein [Bacillota bacterium]